MNKNLEVIIDEQIEKNLYLGRTEYDAPEVDGSVYVRSKKKLKPGDFAKVKIIDTQEYDLVGVLYNEYINSINAINTKKCF